MPKIVDVRMPKITKMAAADEYAGSRDIAYPKPAAPADPSTTQHVRSADARCKMDAAEMAAAKMATTDMASAEMADATSAEVRATDMSSAKMAAAGTPG
jgi:hypothetical protein